MHCLKLSQSSMTLQMKSASEAAGVRVSLCVTVSAVLKVEGREVTSQCAQLRQINHSFTGVCVVSSHGSLGAQDKQCEVGYKVGPSHTLLSIRTFPHAGPVVSATGWEVNPIQAGEFRAVWSECVCVCVCAVGGRRGCVCSLPTWATESGEENDDKDRWSERGEEKQEGKTETECMSRIRIQWADIAVFCLVLRKAVVKKIKHS